MHYYYKCVDIFKSPLYDVYYKLYINYKLYGVHCTLYAVECTAYNVHNTIIRRTMYGVDCTAYNTRRSLYAVRLCGVYRTLDTIQSYAVHCTLYTVQNMIEIYRMRDMIMKLKFIEWYYCLLIIANQCMSSV